MFNRKKDLDFVAVQNWEGREMMHELNDLFFSV